MFSVLGVFFFREVTEGDVINDYMNFKNFGQAYIMLFRVATGEDWNVIMYDCSKLEPDCIAGKTCGSAFAAGYFIFFVLIVPNVMLNLFILVILQQFDKYYLPKDNIIKKGMKIRSNTSLSMPGPLSLTVIIGLLSES